MKNMALLACMAAVAAIPPSAAQMQDNQTPSLKCDDTGHSSRWVNHCEMREQTIAAGGKLTIDGRVNGGIQVKGWTRKDVLVRAKIMTSAATDQEARALASQVSIQASGGSIAAMGPDSADGQRWSVSYEVFTPQRTDLSLKAHNGGIHISDVQGQMEFQTQNGGIHLARVGGDVKGRTQNGGVHIELAGLRWDGQGLDVSSVNGGVHVTMPTQYSARLETSTVNGRVQADIPGITPPDRRAKEMGVNLGAGGPTLHLTTTNGGVHISHSGA